mgnify:CR=1 FL=1
MTYRSIRQSINADSPDAATRRLTRRRRAFSLIELLVVLAIIAMLAAIMIPSLRQAREQAIGVQCLNNLRQMAIAAHSYCAAYRGRFPPHLFGSPDGTQSFGWDLIVESRWVSGTRQSRVRPGLLWQGKTVDQINRCPSYRGGDNWVAYPYTGYNYNSSYIGFCDYRAEMTGWPPKPTGRIVAAENPACAEQVRQPARTALFGDGEYVAGANKFMRAPFKGRDGSFSGRSAGTQGYRHRRRTNVAFSDAHAESWSKRFTNTYDFDEPNVLPHGEVPTGFLSPDNSLYDLE